MPKTAPKSPKNAVFEELYAKLNKEQKKAVDTIEGPVMVIAGPGTGKTQILALRIANILDKTDTSPDSILALTFTESGVSSMRRRLVGIIGTPAYKIKIATFHSFCNDLIQEYPEEFERIIGSNPASDIDQIKIMERLILGEPLRLLKPFGDQLYYVRPALGAVRNLKRENVSPADFAALVAEQEKNFELIPDRFHEKGAHKGKMKGEYADLKKKIEKNKELCVLYEKYEAALREKKLYDYEDMLVEAIRSFESSSDFLLRLQERYQYILADEHQDSNAAQNKILELLSGFFESPNLFIVGDEKQAIFRFQGASLDNFLYFKKKYPDAAVISLESNYRSTQPILDSAHSLIEHNTVEDKSLRIRLLSHAGHRAETEKVHPKISICECETPDAEYAHIVAGIRERLGAGVQPEEIAVIYRDNRDALPIAHALEKAGIVFSLQSDQDILADSDIQNLVLLLRCVEKYGDNELLARVLYINFLGIPNLDAHKAISYAARERRGICDILGDGESLAAAGIKDPAAINELCEKLARWNSQAKNQNLVQAIECIMNESGYLAHIISQPHALERIAKTNAFFAEVKKIAENNKAARLADLISFIDILSSYGILLKTIDIGSKAGVRLMTAHKSKGLEFDYVYVTGLYDGHWGNKRDMRLFHIPIKGLESNGDPMEDERRLLYVALTRAKMHVSASYSKTGISGKEQLPAQFISELNAELVERIAPQAGQDPQHMAYLRNELIQDVEPLNRAYLQELFLQQGLSVTGLNKYLKCPWEYFFTQLIRLPQADSRHQLYGQAIHATLREFFNAYRQEEDMSCDMLLKIFEGNLAKKPLSEADFKDCLEKGAAALRGYYDAYKNTWQRNLATEFGISDVVLEGCIETPEGSKDLALRGFLDKIEFLDDRRVNVVDYKTGKPKSRNAIMGETQSSDGNYYNQLAFYKLLLSRHDDGAREMVSGEIDFIEPDEKGRYHKERFEITDEEVEAVERETRRVANEIHSLSFWNSHCDDKDCEYCALRRSLS